MTSAGKATRPASQSRGSLILVASLGRGGQPRRQQGIAQPLVKTGEDTCQSRKRFHHEPIEDGVEKPPFQRNQEHLLSCAIRLQDAQLDTGNSTCVIADRVLCTPHDLSIQTPQLTVSALVPMPKADDATAADRR